MPDQIPKAVRKQLGALAGAVYEAAMRQALKELDVHFDRWRRNEIDSFELARRIHEFHDGTNRELYDQFSSARAADQKAMVAYGVFAGLIEESAVSAEVQPYIERWLAFYRSEG